MAVFWSYGAVFGLFWLIFFVPLAIVGTVWFWLRRDEQPIKARHPALVVVTDMILISYAVLMCCQRILGDSYPCVLNIWSGYVGTITLFNVYIWRCWVLYFTFNLTQHRILNKTMEELPYFLRNRRWITGPFLVKLLGTLLVVLLLPTALLTSSHDDIIYEPGTGLLSTGDKACNWHWGKQLLPAYCSVYALVFCWFAWSLRSVHDGFQIQQELKFTGLTSLMGVVPWTVFNIMFKQYNNEVFPFSTLAVLLTVLCAYCLSTLWPLYRSIWRSSNMGLEDLKIPANLNTVRGLLSTEEGRESFKEFLTKEFSVENFLFHQEIQKFRKLKLDQALEEVPNTQIFVDEANRIYQKYIVEGPFQVNLPAHIVQDLQTAIKDFSVARVSLELGQLQQQRQRGDSIMEEEEEEKVYEEEKKEPDKSSCPTIFDDAQDNIFKLMETDSSPRYFRSDLFRQLTEKYQLKTHKTQVMQEMKLI